MKRLVWIVALVLLFVILTGFKSGFRIRNIASSLPKHPDLQYDKRRLDQIDQVIIHHSATPVRASPESIARYHVGPNHISSEGIPGIAYHFLINFSGQVFQVN